VSWYLRTRRVAVDRSTVLVSFTLGQSCNSQHENRLCKIQCRKL